jgi:NAD(P)-dependent dehydrogenase (short-subunit alcohol dehydrogenase family)
VAKRWDLRGRTALVTGAGRGIGAEVARGLAARGANVAIVDLNLPAARAVAAEIGPAARAFEADISKPKQIEAAVAAAVRDFGGLDVAIANAAFAEYGLAESFDPDSFRRVLEVALVGTWRTMRATAPHLIERRGYALFISSMAGVIQTPLLTPYNASKAAVQAIANTMRIETEATGLAIGVAYFGFVGSEGGREGREDPTLSIVLSRLPERFIRLAPVEGAAAAVVDGIERRSRSIVYPSANRAVIALHDLPQRIGDRMLRKRGIPEAVRSAGGRSRGDDPRRSADS